MSSNLIIPGQEVLSDFSVVKGVEYHPNAFDEPHIGIAATLSLDGIAGNARYADFWRALGAHDGAIWEPGSDIRGWYVITQLVDKAAAEYIRHGLLPEGATHNIYGEVISFDGVEHGGVGDYADNTPHIDFVPPDKKCAVLIAASSGGTIGWKIQFFYKSNIEPSYASEVGDQTPIRLEPSQAFFSDDARTFMHARDTSNVGRSLTRIFIGE